MKFVDGKFYVACHTWQILGIRPRSFWIRNENNIHSAAVKCVHSLKETEKNTWIKADNDKSWDSTQNSDLNP